MAFEKINLTEQVSGELPVANGGTGVGSVTTSPTATAFAGWDSNGNLSADVFIASSTSTASAGGTTTLTISSTQIQIFTGTASTQTVVLPTTGITAGMEYQILNQGTSGNLITVQASSGATIVQLVSGSYGTFTAMVNTPTVAAQWQTYYGTGRAFGYPNTSGFVLATVNATGLGAITGTPSSTNYVQGDGTWNVPGTTTPTATTPAQWDSNLNLTCNNVMQGQTITATAAGTTTLTITSAETQVFTGTSTQTVKLPTTSVPEGADWTIINQSTGAVTVQSSGANTIIVLPGAANAPFASAEFTALTATPTTAANWNYQFLSSRLSSPPVTITNSNAISTTLTPVAALSVPAATVAAGQAFKVKVFGTQSSTSGSVTYQIRVSTVTTTAGSSTASSTAVCSVSPAVAASGGAYFEGLLTVRTTGACFAMGVGMGSATLVSTQTATVSFNTTAQNYVSVAVVSNAGTHTVQQAYIAWGEG